MAKFVLVFNGGAPAESEMEEHKKEWGAWIQGLGDKYDSGLPFGDDKKSVKGPDGSVSDYSGDSSGYMVIDADSIDDAVDTAKDAPHQKNGGSTDVFSTVDMKM